MIPNFNLKRSQRGAGAQSQIPNGTSAVILLVLTGLTSSWGVGSTAAQETIPVCQTPKPGEYILLVVSPTAASQEQVVRALPPGTNTTVCRYLNDTVSRIGGFTKIEDANGWAKYINDIVGLSAFVSAAPVVTTSNPTTSTTVTSVTTQNRPRYSPRPLGSGYAVLVDYFNRPEIANQVRQLLASDVGLVSYGQRPYLLAFYSKSQKDANSTLQKLSDRGFFALLVDSRKVTLLRSAVGV